MHGGLTLNGLLWGLEPQANVLPVPKATLAWDLLGGLLEPAEKRAYKSSHDLWDKGIDSEHAKPAETNSCYFFPTPLQEKQTFSYPY